MPLVKTSPLDPSHAAVALEDAADREQIFDVLLRAVRSRTKFAALLSVHADGLRGRRALADSVVEKTRIDSWRIPRGAVQAFETAIESHAATVTTLASDEPFVDGLLEQLGGKSPAVLILPLAIGTRTVALVVAHRGAVGFALADVAELPPLADAVSPALTRVLSSRAKTTQDRPTTSDPGYEVEVHVADIDKLRSRVRKQREQEDWEKLSDAIRELIAEGMRTGEPDEDEQLELLLELGQIEADRLGRIDSAIDAWRSAQTIDAGEPRVLDAMQALFVQHARWADSADLLEKRIALSEEPAARIAQLLELAALAHERLDDAERAIAAYERVLHWEPEHNLATRELEHLYSAREQWEPLAALLLDRASREEDATALEAVAHMYEDKLGDLRAALLVWLAVFRREPDREHLIDQIDRLATAAQAWDELVTEGAALAEELEATHPGPSARVWRLVGMWTRDHTTSSEDAAHAFANAARLETDPTTRSDLYCALGEVYEGLGALPEAIACFERARTDEPESRMALVELRRLYRQTAAWEQLAELLPQLISALDPESEHADGVALRVELGGVLADELGRSEDAIAAYTAALALEPKHPAAFQGLAAVYQATGQTEALLDASEAEVDGGDRAAQLVRYPEVARAWQERGRFDRAIACWQKLVEVEPRELSAHRGLAGALHANEQWGSLATELRALLDLTTVPADRLALMLELGGVLATQLDDLDGALAVYQAALGIDPANRDALDALVQLYEHAGQLSSAIAVLQRLLEHTPEPRPRADLFQRLGHAHLDAGDVAGARSDFERALALDLERALAHEGMARVHLLENELVAGGEELVRAAELAATEQDKIRCLVDAAWVFRHRLKDSERARNCLHLVLELEPEHGDAKLALAELLQDSQQWESLWPHLEQEVQRVKADDALTASERCDVYTRAARCALELDRFGVAIELFDLACASEGGPEVQIERADAMYRAKLLEAAAAAFQTIVLRHAQVLDRDRMISVYRRLAEIHTTLGKLSQAQLFHQKVLELDKHNRATLKDLAELHATRGRYDEAIANLRALVELASPAEKAALLERIGDFYRDRLKNAPRAMSTYVEALEHEPSNRRVLQRLLEVQSTAGQWKAAVETIDRFLAHEADPTRRAAYHIAAAEIRRNELRDRTGALDDYDRALDELFHEQPLTEATRMRGLDTFRTVDELVTADKNWRYQEQSYRKMIKRVPQDDPALVPLWDALGEIYRSRLKHYESAIEAFEIAHSIDPDKSAQRAGILAELYALAGKARPKQVAVRAAKLVEADPVNPEAYRALGRASFEAGKTDEAWCAARALVFLKQANADETALYKQLRKHEVRKATGFFDEDSWGLVRHPDEDRTISSIFTLVWEGAVALRAGPAKAFELKPKERLPVEDGSRVIAKIFRHTARVLTVALPDVYIQPHRSGRLLLANCIDRGRLSPAVIVGRDLMTGYRDTELAASVAALLALLRPAYYLKLALPSVDELEAALAAAAALVGRAIGRPQLEPLRTELAGEMQTRLPRGAEETLRALVARLPDQPDLARWRNAVDLTAQRAGLLVCGELAAAARMLATEAAAPGRARPNQRVHELVAYSVSPAYFAARQHLGVAVA
jgi:tetratricopeptide (TPR) repeat protein